MTYRNVVENPSIWDYLGDALSQGHRSALAARETWKQDQREAQALARQDRQDRLARAQMRLGLREQGVLPSEANAGLSDELAALQIIDPGTQLNPSLEQEKAGIKRRLAGAPKAGTMIPTGMSAQNMVAAPSPISRDEAKLIGAELPEETAQAQAELLKYQGLVRIHSGKGTPQDYLVNGITRPEEAAIKLITDIRGLASSSAQNDVAVKMAEAAAKGLGGKRGKIDPVSVGEGAYKNFLAVNPNLSAIGLKPDEILSIKNIFIGEAVRQQQAQEKILFDRQIEWAKIRAAEMRAISSRTGRPTESQSRARALYTQLGVANLRLKDQTERMGTGQLALVRGGLAGKLLNDPEGRQYWNDLEQLGRSWTFIPSGATSRENEVETYMNQMRVFELDVNNPLAIEMRKAAIDATWQAIAEATGWDAAEIERREAQNALKWAEMKDYENQRKKAGK